MITEEVYEHVIEEETYFISMTDMMVGLIFIFIILLMYFALQFQDMAHQFQDVTDQLTSANRTRAQILHELQDRLIANGILNVTIDTERGVLHLPDSILFDKGKADLGVDKLAAAAKLAVALEEVLPCYVTGGGFSAKCKSHASHFIESVYIEGHTDIDISRGVGCLQDNLALSACMSVETFRALIRSKPSLTKLCTRNAKDHCEKILSVSGYGDERMISELPGEQLQAQNRRIDLRILMLTPDGGTAAKAVANRLRQ